MLFCPARLRLSFVLRAKPDLNQLLVFVSQISRQRQGPLDCGCSLNPKSAEGTQGRCSGSVRCERVLYFNTAPEQGFKMRRKIWPLQS